MIRHAWQYVERSAESYPEKVAFTERGRAITYSDFKSQCEVVATKILEVLKLDKNSISQPQCRPIAILMGKNIGALISFFSCALSGNFYCPLDISAPKSRQQKIFSQLRPSVVVTDHANLNLATELAEEGVPVIVLDDCLDAQADVAILRRISDQVIDTDLLYVIFTSGSTGHPKGVCVSHRAVIDYTEWAIKEFDLKCHDRIGNQGPFYFDLSVHDIFTTVSTGASMHLINDQLFSYPVKVVQELIDQKIDSIFWIPSALVHIANSKILSTLVPKALKRIMFCGEVMPVKQLNIWRNVLPLVNFVNLYGPTEATEACTFFVVDRNFRDDEVLPIGKPCANTKVFVVAENGRVILPGMADQVGELYIRGSCLSYGYINDPERTAQNFVQNPSHRFHQDIVYRTGDLVRYNEFQELMYVGRTDFQIKRLGYRIELGEIEAAAISIGGVEQSCAIYNAGQAKILLFYSGADLSEGDVENQLRVLLPKYMWPSKITKLAAIPLNQNRKYDRQKLQEDFCS